MARRYGRRSRGPSRTRMLNWTANSETATTATAAATTRSIQLLDSGALAATQTLYRIVGSLWVAAQADARCIVHYGVYLRPLTETVLDPATNAAKEVWLWWGAFHQVTRVETSVASEGSYIPIDIKVKRIVQVDTQAITLVVRGSVAIDSLLNVRILSKATGTR